MANAFIWKNTSQQFTKAIPIWYFLWPTLVSPDSPFNPFNEQIRGRRSNSNLLVNHFFKDRFWICLVQNISRKKRNFSNGGIKYTHFFVDVVFFKIFIKLLLCCVWRTPTCRRVKTLVIYLLEYSVVQSSDYNSCCQKKSISHLPLICKFIAFLWWVKIYKCGKRRRQLWQHSFIQYYIRVYIGGMYMCTDRVYAGTRGS